MKPIEIYSIKSYFLTIVLFWLASIYLLVNLGYHDSFLFLNSHHMSLLDKVVPYFTQFGDSLILSSLVLIFLSRVNTPLAFTIVISILSSGLVLVSLKYFLFPDWHRPLKVLGEDIGIHYVKGHIEYVRSFPSGHTTTIASAFPLIAFLFRKRSLQVLIAVIGVLICYTRIYLGSHFLGDVLAGSILGTSFAVAGLIFLYPKIKNIFFGRDEKTKGTIKRYSLIVGLTGFIIGISIRFIF